MKSSDYRYFGNSIETVFSAFDKIAYLTVKLEVSDPLICSVL